MRSIPPWLFLFGVIGFVVSTAVCAGLAYLTTQQLAIDLSETGLDVPDFADLLAARPTATNPPSTAAPTTTPTHTPASDEPTAVIEATSAAPVLTSTPDPLAGVPTWDDPRSLTILLLGIDQRSGFDTDQTYRTDTMIVVHIDPTRKHVGLLSIPRDLYVDIPGFTRDRINNANVLGDGSDYPGGGGPALAADTVEATLGITIDRYVRINFDVFETVVDTLAPDGIEICVDQVIDDPDYPDAGYGTIAVRFETGCQMMNAEQLLQYARTRATQGGDFDRARRQQQVLTAAQDQILTVSNIPFIVSQIPTLWTQLSDSFVTNLTIDDLTALAGLATEIDSDRISSGVIGPPYVDFAKNAAGDDVLVLRFGQIGGLIEQVFNPQPDLTLGDLRTRSDEENASIVVYNDTFVPGLAGNTRDWLASKQVQIDEIGNIPDPTNGVTIIRDYTGNPWTSRYLAALLGIPQSRIQAGTDGLTSADIMVIVGEDVQPLLAGEVESIVTDP